MNTLKKISALLILFSFVACAKSAPATSIPAQPLEATSPPAEVNVTSEPTEISAATEVAATEAVVVEEEVIYGELARGHIETITEEIGARWSGTQEESATAQYIEEAFTEMGYEPVVKPFERMGWVDDETETAFKSANVIAVKEGESARVMVVGAHYDSVTDGLGADDNASGVGILLELAERLADVSTPYTIYFVAFGGEEAGLLGSTDYVYSASKDELQNIIGFVNLDSVIAGDYTYVYGNEGKPELRDWALNWASENDIELQTIYDVELNDEDGYGTSDVYEFDNARIPFAYFESTNWTLGDKDGYTQVDPQYGDDGAIIHTEYDTLEYIDETFPGRVDAHLNDVIRIVYALLTEY